MPKNLHIPSWLKTLYKGNYDEFRGYFLEGDKIIDTYVDENETEHRLIEALVKGIDKSKNTSHPLGGSQALLIDKDSKEWIEGFDLNVYRAVNNLTKRRLLIVDCDVKGVNAK